MSGKENKEVANASWGIHIEPSILMAPLKSPNSLKIWVSCSDTSFPCFDCREYILPFLQHFFPAAASIKCVTNHESLVAYQVDIKGWLAIPLIVYEIREFRPALYEYKKKVK